MPYPDDFSSARLDARMGRDEPNAAVEDDATRIINVNLAVVAILERAAKEIGAICADTPSLIYGYDLADIVSLLRTDMVLMVDHEAMAYEAAQGRVA